MEFQRRPARRMTAVLGDDKVTADDVFKRPTCRNTTEHDTRTRDLSLYAHLTTLYDWPHTYKTTITSIEILRTTIKPFPEPSSVGLQPTQARRYSSVTYANTIKKTGIKKQRGITPEATIRSRT